MIKPRVSCELFNKESDDVYGEPVLSAGKKTRCNVVRLVVDSQKTTVRADSSASRGNIDELVSVSKLLFLPKEDISYGGKVIVSGVSLKVIGIHLRFDVNGRLDHKEVECEVWA